MPQMQGGTGNAGAGTAARHVGGLGGHGVLHNQVPPSASAATAPPPAASAMAAEAIQSARKSMQGRRTLCGFSSGGGGGDSGLGRGEARPGGEGGWGYGGWPQWGHWGRVTLEQIKKSIDDNAGLAAAAFGGGWREAALEQQPHQQVLGQQDSDMQQQQQQQQQQQHKGDAQSVDPQTGWVQGSCRGDQLPPQPEEPEDEPLGRAQTSMSRSRTSYRLLELAQDSQE